MRPRLHPFRHRFGTPVGVALLVAHASSVSGGVINVPADKPTIQAAITSAVTGDEIVLAPGTYFERPTLSGKAITIRGSGGADVTIIDGQSIGRVLNITSNPGTIVLQGLTIRNGKGGGAGVRLESGTIDIRSCVFTGNSAQSASGGGLRLEAGTTGIVSDSTFTLNTASSGRGGGISGEDLIGLTVTNTTFSENVASSGSGNAIGVVDSPVTITNSFFTLNGSATGSAGLCAVAVSGVDASATVTGTEFRANRGGCLAVRDGASAVVESCLFELNSRLSAIYAVGAPGAQLSVSDSLFKDNVYQSGSGAGISAAGVSLNVTNCEFLANQVPGGTGAGIDADRCTGTITDCVFIGNSAENGSGAGVSLTASTLTLSNGFFEGNFGEHAVRSADQDASTIRDCQILNGSGGIAINEASPRVERVTISGMELSSTNGAGILIAGFEVTTPVIDRCVIENCTAVERQGGGMAIAQFASPKVSNVVIRNCRSIFNGARGGGVYINTVPGEVPVLTNVLIDNCSAPIGAGIAFRFGAVARIVNGTIVGCDGSGGIHASDDASPRVFNTIIRGNAGGNIVDQTDAPFLVEYSNIEGGFPGTGNIDADALFEDAGAGDYRLASGSSSIDAGNNAEIDDSVVSDLGGASRRVDVSSVSDSGAGTAPIVDMGAYESQGTCLADFDGTGFVDIEDYTAFVLEFELGGQSADVDGTGFVDIEDFTLFVLRFEAGC